MTCRTLEVERYKWRARVFLGSTSEDLPRMDKYLDQIDCPREIRLKIANLVNGNEPNSGYTYSNKVDRKSVMVIGYTTSPAQALNTFCHELRHLCDDIADATDIGMSGEPVAYLTGEIAEELFDVFHPFICCQRYRIHPKINW